MIHDLAEQKRIVQSVHMGSGDSDTVCSIGGHIGIHRTRAKILEKFFWKRVAQDVKEFVSRCDNCQKVNPVPRQDVAELHPVPVASGGMVQIRVGTTNFPKIDDGYCFAVVALDYFSKRPEARALKDHTAESVAKFLFEGIICHHGCVKIQINDQGREFVNKVFTELHRLSGVEQHVTGAYHPQANRLVERQNMIIKDSIMKSLSDRSNWVQCLPAVLFSCIAHHQWWRQSIPEESELVQPEDIPDTW